MKRHSMFGPEWCWAWESMNVKESDEWRTVNNTAIKVLPDGSFLIAVPGVSKDEVSVEVIGNKTKFGWESEYNTGEVFIVTPEKTTDISVEVDKGLIKAKFITQQSDINIEIK